MTYIWRWCILKDDFAASSPYDIFSYSFHFFILVTDDYYRTAGSLHSRQFFLDESSEFPVLTYDECDVEAEAHTVVYFVVPAVAAGEALGDIAL